MKRFGQFSHMLASTALAVATVFSAGGVSRAADLLSDADVDSGSVCSDQRVLKSIVSRFSYQTSHVPNLPVAGISAFSDVSQNRYEAGAPAPAISRHYCRAVAVLTDGEQRRVWYMIEEGQGFASIGDNVEFCVAGFDRWNVYDGACRVLR